MLRFRLMIGSLLIAGFLAILGLDEWLAPWFPLWFCASLAIITLAAKEVAAMLQSTSAAPSTNTVLGGCWAILLANWAPHVLTDQQGLGSQPFKPFLDLAWPFWAFAFVVMAAFVLQALQFRQPGRTMAKLSGTILAIAYVGALGSFLIQFRWLEGKHHGVIPLLMLVATAKGADTGAYTIGRIAGKRKLWPALSPNKTIEGAIGGMIFGLAAAVAVAAVGSVALGDHEFRWARVIGFGVLIGWVAQLGDLMESMIKRDCETKDASHALPGFGGVLDVLDSMLFAAPVGYAYWLVFWP